MAWNQPGGGKSPWGRRPGQGGGDLDEKVKNWQRKLESLFRPGGQVGEGGAGGGGGGGGGGAGPLLIIALIALALWIGSGFFQVGAAERGVIQRFGRLVDVRPQGMGWHWPWPIETVTKVNVANVNRTPYKSRVLTADVSLVDLKFAVQYEFGDATKALFQVRDPEATLREVSESAIREVVGQSNLEDVLVGATRPEVTRRTKALIQRTLDYYNTGIHVTTVNLIDVQVPEAVVPSQRDANKALADQERAVKEAQAYASGVLPAAQGQASRTQQEAQAYRARVVALAEGEAARFSELAAAYERAPEVTRERLYLETMENVFGRANKVLVEKSAGAGGNVLYLPLDKLVGHGAAAGASGSDNQQSESIRPTPTEPDTVTVDGRTRGER
jgi:membrane protease subunit HflK